MSIFVLIVESTVIVRCVLYICFLAHRLAVVSSWTHCMIVQNNPLNCRFQAERFLCTVARGCCTIMIGPKSPSLFHSRGNEKQPFSGGPQKAYATGMVPDVTPGKTK